MRHYGLDAAPRHAKLIETYQPTYDYQGVMKALVERLAALGQRPAALDLCVRLRNVDGMPKLFAKLRAANH
jgi:hypothetical protein